MTLLLIIIAVLFIMVYVKLHEIITDIAEFKMHGLDMYCDDPSAHYIVKIGKKAKK